MSTKPSLFQYAMFILAAFLAIFVAYDTATEYFEQKRVMEYKQHHADAVKSITVKSPNGNHELEPSSHFIGECSDMDLSDSTVYLVAVSECVGRVRGFIEGHNLMISMLRMAGNNNARNAQLFCVGPNVEASDVVTSIMDWSDANYAEYANTVDAADPSSLATIIMIKALKANYACANT